MRPFFVYDRGHGNANANGQNGKREEFENGRGFCPGSADLQVGMLLRTCRRQPAHNLISGAGKLN